MWPLGTTGAALLRSMTLVSLLALAFASSGHASPERWQRGGFITDFSKSTVDFKDIFSGGPPKDGIPSIDEPQFETASTITWLDGREPVIRLEQGDVIKAYPLQILIWHEIVNDRIDDLPVAVTYCPLCNSSIVFDRRLDSELLDFGTTGLLRNSDLVMYDRQSETWWQQFTGEGIVGTHAGRELKMIPSRVVAFADFKKAHPNAEVLARPVPARRNYGHNPYLGYDSRSAPYPLYKGDLPGDINPMARVVILRNGDTLIAATLEHIRQNGALELEDGVSLRWTGEISSILDKGKTDAGRSIGSVDAVKTSGSDEVPLVHDVTFAFVVHAFHPELPILGIKSP
ncbi:DUF3179 domain-containing protein [uncultured Roseibium sp.]|uniref:DUF3179 domain-containing protein n=1 Tax=uncultured Roseibium sp. TaxID=1936171 RepID=UPI0026254CBA|nr:DUF3179 domain-containing protein [uncultured Roseibium sp.]